MNVRVFLRRCATGGAALAFAAAGLFVSAPSATAHRDGCHRWHSCPSDTGSYVCGDLGYFSECGYDSLPDAGTDDDAGADPGTDDDAGAGSDAGSGTDDDAGVDGGTGSGTEDGAGAYDGQEAAEDYESPEAPSAVKPGTGAGGKVTVTAKAESGSRIEVREVTDPDYPEDGETVAKATATGASQTVSFTADSGEHTYVLIAVDAADNSSEASEEFTVEVDADRPALDDLAVGDPDGSTGAVDLSFTTDPDTDYDVRVAGTTIRLRGTTDDGAFREPLWLPNGKHKISGTLRDEAGNVTKLDETAVVRVDALTPLLESKSPSRDGGHFTVTGPRAARGTLEVGTQKREVILDDDGHATISLALADGSYVPKVALTDPFGRAATAEGARTVVDTEAPKATLTYDKERAHHQELVLVITGEPGATARITAPKDLADGELTLNGEHRRTLRMSAAPGDVAVAMTVTDEAGNSSTRTLTVHVSDDWTTAQIVVALILSLLVLVAVVVLWVRRERIATWREARRRARVVAAAQREKERRDAERAEERARREQAARRAQAAYERELATWKAERKRLAARVSMARDLETGQLGSTIAWRWGKRRKGEEVLSVAAGALVEVRQRQGVQYNETVDRGEVVVTDRRVLFVGSSRKREWDYAKWLGHDHFEPGLTMILVSNRQKSSGIDCVGPDAERLRLSIDVGLSRYQGTWSALLDRLQEEVEAHARLRPDRPGERHGGVTLGKPVG
ncbi:hypothetical protein OKJ48_40765 [Streptomyces kunmingensis]|uniref:Ig-like domain (Group 3) n=1 Tax=Streptomyces kunmingensis TaxID=68225 RepID=A0ABU6CP99_9ACTN|nr:hypothetical protein [Streptomyces kunmingensis]MEB3966518.1 hypothetical protein [Streptomyces kunmingensis]